MLASGSNVTALISFTPALAGVASTPTTTMRLASGSRVKSLPGLEIQANPKSYHLWLTLPPHWRGPAW